MNIAVVCESHPGGAAHRPEYLSMLSSAAGTMFPARVFVIGTAGAGLPALATAKRLDAVVTATEVRPEAKERIQAGRLIATGDRVSPARPRRALGAFAKELPA